MTKHYPLSQFNKQELSNRRYVAKCFGLSSSQDNADGNALDVDKASLDIPC